MKLKDNGIYSIEDWFRIAPPKDGIRQWKDGRSAKELARYLTSALPELPEETEGVLLPLTSKAAIFEWRAEYKNRTTRKGISASARRRALEPGSVCRDRSKSR